MKEAHDAGQKLAFRVMCCSTTRGEPYHPRWLTAQGGKELLAEYNGERFPIPDLDDPITLKHHLDFIRRLGERYDGHPDIDHVDLGSIGWWGEWHLSGSDKNKLPTLKNRTRLIDAYFAAFKKTPLLMLIGGGQCLKDACGRGAGSRTDCLGDLGGFSKTWCHMRKGYPEFIRQAGIENDWKTAPVAWETCWDMRNGPRRVGRCGTSSIMLWHFMDLTSTTSQHPCHPATRCVPSWSGFSAGWVIASYSTNSGIPRKSSRAAG